MAEDWEYRDDDIRYPEDLPERLAPLPAMTHRELTVLHSAVVGQLASITAVLDVAGAPSIRSHLTEQRSTLMSLQTAVAEAKMSLEPRVTDTMTRPATAHASAKPVTRFFLDTEFYEDGKTIDLISLGIVCDNGVEFYGENADFDWDRVPAQHWLQENVRPHLLGPSQPHVWFDRDALRDEVLDMVNRQLLRPHGKPEFWAYYADYDWVTLCQLFGTMVELPEGWPMLCMDLKQWAIQLGIEDLPKQNSAEHHALHDARHDRDLYYHLLGFTPGGTL